MDKRIFVVEDDDSIREMVKIALTSFSYEAVAFANAEDALADGFDNPPELFIFDIMLPGMSGLDATKKVRANPETANVPIILLTAKDAELDKVTGLDCGADDYIAKPFGIMELGARIRSLLRRVGQRVPDTAETVDFSGLTVNDNTREVNANGRTVNLTYKEYELLRVLIRERNRIVPREELLKSVWGVDFVGESRTLDIHIRTLRQKLGDDSEHPTFIKTARNVGYRFIGARS
jgi:two-component system alkaline phosphatase synthesis response regulator PhoP